jgi:hypothetical protein
MTDQMTGSLQSWLPVQAAPVDRTPGGVALSGGSGVEASGLLDLFGLGGAKPYIEDIGGKLWNMFA